MLPLRCRFIYFLNSAGDLLSTFYINYRCEGDILMDTLLNLFLENDRELKKAFRWEQNIVKKNAAFQMAVNNQRVDIRQIKEMIDYMKENTSSFSYFLPYT